MQRRRFSFNLWLGELKLLLYACVVITLLLLGMRFHALAIDPESAEVRTSSAGLTSRVAPGELLPFSIKLLNFGGGRRVDVTIDYQILDSNGEVVLTENETVAVETTASFVKVIQLPHTIPPGEYVAVSSIIYQDQEVPATSRFRFTVERKIAGIFLSQFILYGSITLLISIAFAVTSRLIIKRRRITRFTPYDYSNIPKKDRIFYELVSDTIMQMRRHVGDEALDIAENVKGLVVDGKTGKVVNIKEDPAKIIALLVLQYETLLGRKVSFALRQPDQHVQEQLVPVKKNVGMLKKYFE